MQGCPRHFQCVCVYVFGGYSIIVSPLSIRRPFRPYENGLYLLKRFVHWIYILYTGIFTCMYWIYISNTLKGIIKACLLKTGACLTQMHLNVFAFSGTDYMLA